MKIIDLVELNGIKNEDLYKLKLFIFYVSNRIKFIKIFKKKKIRNF